MIIRIATAIIPGLMLLCSFLAAQPYATGRLDTTFVDPDREGRKIPARILYPADSAGRLAPASSAIHGGFPVLVFGHGYMMPVDAYRNIWEATVPEGFVFVLPESGSGLFPSHLEFGKDMAFLLKEMFRLGHDSTSLFYQRIRRSGAMMGHSMGGGAAVLGTSMLQSTFPPASGDRDTLVLLLLAPLDTRPSSVGAADSIAVPALIIAGTEDWITPPEKHQFPIYDSLQSPHKYLISIRGGTHCQMAEKSRICNFAEDSFDRLPGISREEQHGILTRYMVPWLEFFLYGDSDSGLSFEKQLKADKDIEFYGRGRLEAWQ